MKNKAVRLLAVLLTVSVSAVCIFQAGAAALTGDVNGDGNVLSDDALIILEHSVGIINEEYNDETLLDINKDGSVDAADALMVLEISVGRIKPEETSEDTSDGTSSENPAPRTKAEVLSLYNDAVNKVIASKAGYSKTRKTELTEIEGADALMKIAAVREGIYQFLGVGESEYVNKKGAAEYISASALTDAEVTDARCVLNGGTYTVTLSLADGKSTAPSGSDSSPLRHCGLFAGNSVNEKYDYQNAANIYSGIAAADGASVKSVTGTTTGAVISAVIDAETGNLNSLKIDWQWGVKLDTIKYSIIRVSANGTAESSVEIKDFVW